MTRITDNQTIVTIGSTGEQDLRHMANEELFTFFAETFVKYTSEATNRILPCIVSRIWIFGVTVKILNNRMHKSPDPSIDVVCLRYFL